jgi:hypothetical protein
MKLFLIIGAAVVVLVLTFIGIGVFTPLLDNHTQVGHFDVYTGSKQADSSVQSTLYYKHHLLTRRLNNYSLDPNDPDRILFSSDDIFHGVDGACGTLLYDGRSRQLTTLRPWPYAGNMWSPDSHFVILDRATVHDLITGQEVDLTNAVSTIDGKRPDFRRLQWSPDSQRLAASIMVPPPNADDRTTVYRDQDLIEITLEPLSVRYVATIADSSLVWMEEDIRWVDGLLQVTAPSTPKRRIVIKSPESLTWTTRPPTMPPRPMLGEHYCESR